MIHQQAGSITEGWNITLDNLYFQVQQVMKVKDLKPALPGDFASNSF